MTMRSTIRTHLDTSGESMRALSVRAGLNPKAVSDILNRPQLRPTARTQAALSTVIGVSLPAPEMVEPKTYARLIREVHAMAGTDSEKVRSRRMESRIRWFLRKTGKVAETELVDRNAVKAFFARNRPATFDLSKASYATYKSDLLAVIGRASAAPRKVGIRDIGGFFGEAHKVITESSLLQDLKFVSGSFLVWLHQNSVQPNEITRDTLEDYYRDRLDLGVKGEKTCRKHVKRIADLLSQMQTDPQLAALGFAVPGHPFEDGRDKYRVPDSRISALMDDFERRAVPWLRGEVSHTGQDLDAFIEELDRRKPVDKKKALLRAGRDEQDRARPRRKPSEEEARSAGFLLANEIWSDSTLRKRRAFIRAAAKALYASTGYLIETLEELTDPEVVESLAETLAGANGGEFRSSYVSTGIKAIRKLARDFVRRPLDELEQIKATLKYYDLGRKGITERNKDRLRQFTKERQEAFHQMSVPMIREINQEISARKARRKTLEGKVRAEFEIYTPAIGRKVMLVLAHDIMLRRAPRSANLTGIRLDWIRWNGERATIEVPAEKVKARDPGDPPLTIPLDPDESHLLRVFLEKLRPRVLAHGDERNPYLFPSQGARTGQPYRSLLARLCRDVHRRIGVRIHPHLYRHLVGWCWLRDDPGALPAVQKILGHKSLQTTVEYYAEVDEDLAVQLWSKYQDGNRKSRQRARLSAQQ